MRRVKELTELGELQKVGEVVSVVESWRDSESRLPTKASDLKIKVAEF